MKTQAKGYKFYGELFLSTFLLSAFTFGGGYVIVPLMRKKFVEKLKWIEENEMLNLIAISQSAPGAIAVNASILVGYRLAGFLGAALTILGTILPPLILLSIISLFYVVFKESAAINAILKGMSVGVAAVVVDAVIKMGRNVANEKSIFSLLIMFLSFVAVFLFNTDAKIIILTCGLLGLANTYYSRKRVAREGSDN